MQLPRTEVAELALSHVGNGVELVHTEVPPAWSACRPHRSNGTSGADFTYGLFLLGLGRRELQSLGTWRMGVMRKGHV